MLSLLRAGFVVVVSLSLLACNGSSSEPDGGGAASVDAGSLDAGNSVDAGSLDAGAQACSDVVDLASDSRVQRTTASWTASLELSGAGNLPLPASCGSSPSGAERVVRLVTPQRARVSVSSRLVSGAPHALWVSTTCGGTASACYPTAREGGEAALNFVDLPAGTELFFTVDAEGAAVQALTLAVHFTPLASVGEACFPGVLACGDDGAVCNETRGSGTCTLAPELFAQRCAMARPVSVGSVAGTLDFSTPSGAFSPSCRFAGVTSTFPEQVFAFTPASTNTFVVRTDVAATHIDTIVSVRDACTASSELACNEDVSATDLRSSLIFNGVAGQTYFVVVQASSNTSGTDLSQAVDGDFQLVIEAL